MMPRPPGRADGGRHAWSARHVPAQGGKVAVVTGANSGLGWQLAETLAAKGATVVMGCRDAAAPQAADAIRRLHPDARVEVDALDLADLASIARFAADVAERHGRVDILCNNAGVMFLPLRHTHDGFEMQFGTNHLGHFALTGHLLRVARARRRGS